MIFSHQCIARMLIALGVMLYFSVTVFGIFHLTMSMDMDGHMTMTHCPLMDGGLVCTMSPLAHISALQSMFITVPQQYSSAFTLSLLLFLVSLAFIAWFRQKYPPPEAYLSRLPYNKRVAIPTLLQALFSSGILNPKLY